MTALASANFHQSSTQTPRNKNDTEKVAISFIQGQGQEFAGVIVVGRCSCGMELWTWSQPNY